jgi:hypothetical protein
MPDDFLRGLKAIFKTALTWGSLLGVFAGSLIGLFVFFVPGGETTPTILQRIGQALFAGAGMGVRFAVAGAILGTLFATMLRLSFRGRRVADLHPGKFALIGAVVGGVGIPLIYQGLNILSGGAIPWGYLLDDIPWAATVGAVGAAGSVWLARRATALPNEETSEALASGERFDDLAGSRPERRAEPLDR